jgi:hypothetical protein
MSKKTILKIVPVPVNELHKLYKTSDSDWRDAIWRDAILKSFFRHQPESWILSLPNINN